MKIRGQRIIPPAERIAKQSRRDPITGCWNWTGAVRSQKWPYGQLVVGSRAAGTRRSIAAHRYSYLSFTGPIPDGMLVCHRCDNPRCVNPAHLFLGTYKDNADDRDRKGRNSPPPIMRGDTCPWAKLTEAQVAEIRSSPLSSYKIAPTYGVSDSHIRALRRGENFVPAPPAEGGGL